MFPHVTKGFLRDTIQLILSVFREFVCSSAPAKRTLRSAIVREVLGELPEGIRQMGAFKRSWSQAQKHSARIFQTTFREFFCASDIFGDILPRCIVQAVRRFQM